MPVEKMLIEYAKLHLNLVQANETIAALQAELARLQNQKQQPEQQSA